MRGKLFEIIRRIKSDCTSIDGLVSLSYLTHAASRIYIDTVEVEDSLSTRCWCGVGQYVDTDVDMSFGITNIVHIALY